MVGAWALLIFALSSIPGQAFPQIKILAYDKLAHGMLYAVLGGLCLWAVRSTWTLAHALARSRRRRDRSRLRRQR